MPPDTVIKFIFMTMTTILAAAATTLTEIAHNGADSHVNCIEFNRLSQHFLSLKNNTMELVLA